MTEKVRYRRQFKFWLDQYDMLEKSLIRIVEDLKQRGAFASAVRDGLRLIWDLRYMDSTDVLLSMFPDIRERLGVSKPPDSDDLVEQFRQMIQSEFKQLPLPMAIPASSGGMKPLAGAHTIAMPSFEESEDDTDIINIKRDTKLNTGASFLDAVFGLQDVEVDLGTDVQHE